MPQLMLPQGPVEVAQEGPPDGPPIVLVHGYSVDAELWRPVAERLAAAGFRTVRPTLPLGSQRVPLGSPLTPRSVAALLADLLAELDLSDATVVGNDTGGAICQFLVDAHPERVGRLVLTNCDAFERFPPPPFDFIFLRLSRVPPALHAFFRLGRLSRATHRLFDLYTARGFPRELVDAWIAPYLDDRAVRAETDGLLRSVDPGELLDVAARLPRFQRPVLIAWGTDDRLFPLSLARRLAAVFPDARLVEIPGARLFVPWDQPERLAGLIEEFARAPVAVP